MKNQERRDMVNLPSAEVEEEALSNFFEVNGLDEQIEEILNSPEIASDCRNTVKLIRRQLKKLNVTEKDFDESLSEESLKDDLIEEMKMLAIKEATRSFFSGEETDMLDALENVISGDLAIKLLEAKKKLLIKKIHRIKSRRDFSEMIRCTTIIQ